MSEKNPKLGELRTRLGVSKDDMASIMYVYSSFYLAAGDDGDADKIPEVLNKYEKEILRQQEVISRLKAKNSNYRRTVKGLQRAHEASLHRENATKESIGQLKQLIQDGAVCGVSTLDEDINSPYTPVGFNNDVAYACP